MTILVILGFIIFTFFNPVWGSWVYIGFIALFEMFIVLNNSSKIKVDNKNNKYTPAEVRVIERYGVFFRFPLTSRGYSKLCSGIGMSAFIFVPWLLFNGLYVQAVLIGLNYFITGQLAVILNPQFFLHQEVEKRTDLLSEAYMIYSADMEAIDSALFKMYSKPDTKGKKDATNKKRKG